MKSEHQTIEELINLNINELRKARLEKWRRYFDISKDKILVFGAGELGLKTLKGLVEEGIQPLAILDNRATNISSKLMGIPVLSPKDALDSFGSDVLCLVSVYNTSGPRAQLSSLGFTKVLNCVDAFAGMPERFLPFVCLEDTDVIPENKQLIKDAFNLMADEKSRFTFTAQLRHRLFLDFETVKAPQTPIMKSSEYFPDDIYKFLDNEVVVDCGAFQGDTISRFIEKRSSNFKSIFALEPDSKNFILLQKYIDGLDTELSKKINALQFGVGNVSELVSFNSEGSVLSGSSKNGNTTVQIEKLDSILAKHAPTLIKMDIEGSEINALRGAKNLISSNTPVLAICIYHLCSHLWEVPLIINKINPNYKFFLRAHAEDCWDVTCYAVPSFRLIN